MAFYAAGEVPRQAAHRDRDRGAVADPAKSPDPQTVWIETAHRFLAAHPAIRAFLWWDDPGKYLHQNPTYSGSGYALSGPGLAAFRAMGEDPGFK